MRMINWVVLTMLVGGTALVPQPSIAAEAVDPCTTPTIVGTEVDDHILGTDGPDVIDALGGNDVVEGLAGDDVICGGDGGDSLIGGLGNNQLYGQEHVIVLKADGTVLEWRPDILNGGAGDDHFDGGGLDYGGTYGGDFITFQDAPQGVEVFSGWGARGDGTDTMVSDTGHPDDVPDDVRWNIIGSPFADLIYGGRAYAETIVGGEGDDGSFGDYGRDTLVDGVSDCECAPGLTVLGGGDDRMIGGWDADIVRGGEGNDSLDGHIGSDHVWGGPGDDIVHGDRGNDRLWGEAGDDIVDGDMGSDYVWGGAENDQVYGAKGSDHLKGGAGNDTVSGDEGGYQSGERGANNVSGGPGDDILTDLGGGGRDWLRGNGGDDVFVNRITARDEYVGGGRGVDKVRRAPDNRPGVRMICRSIEIGRIRGACR